MPKEKLLNRSFAYLNNSGRDFSNTEFLECDFSRSDCTGADFSNSILYLSNFTDAKLTNAVISLNCHFFKGVTFDRKQTEYFIYLLTLADIPEDIKDRLVDILGNKILRLDKAFGQ